MNYERNRKYFVPTYKFNWILFVIAVLLSGTVLFFTFFKTFGDLGVWGYALSGLLVLFGLFFSFVFRLHPTVEDEFIDHQIQAEITRFRAEIVNSFLKKEDFDFLPHDEYYLPLHSLDNMISTSTHRDLEIYEKEGDDGRLRSSQHQVLYYFFSRAKFLVYRYEFSLTQKWIATSYKTYYYQEDTVLEAVEKGDNITRIKEKTNVYLP